MLFFDLRWVLFGCLLVIVTVAALAVLLARRRAPSSIPEEVSAVLDRAPFGWLTLDGPRACRYANPTARRLLGLPPQATSLPEADWVSLLQQDREAARQEMGATGRYRSVTLSAGQTVRWWITPWNELDIVVLLDVSARQRAEQAAGYLLSSLSHELRTPIGTILTHLEILLLPDISEQIRSQSLRLLQAETRRMARLVNQMLELGRLETSEIERRPVDLLALVEQAIAQSAALAEQRNIALSLQADTPLPLIVGQQDRLLQAFLNLLDNGIKYSRPGDRVIVSLGRTDEGVECSVCDTGPGIPAAHLPHVTRRFYRAAPQEIEGSGLGLALVEEILRRHHSRLEIESHTQGEETGTRVSFTLPIIDAP